MADHMPLRFTLLVTSLMRMGAILLVLNFLLTHRKFISAILTTLPLILTLVGVPEMKPKSFPFLEFLRPTCHSLI